MRLPKDLVADLIRALPLASPIEVVDVGASTLSASETPPYEPLLSHGLARLTGFEPNPAEFAKLQSTQTRRYLPDAIGDGGPATLHLTRHPGFASTLAPDPGVTGQIHSFTALTEVTGRQLIQTTRLDDITDLPRIDLLKIDIQGGELAAFRGGSQKLSRVLCVQTEVAFVPIYRDQPLFADQDAALRALGLRFFGFASAHRFPFTGTPNDLYFAAKRHDIGQWIDADAIYLTDFTRWEALPEEELARLFFILAMCYPATSATLRLAQGLVAKGALSQDLYNRLLIACGPTP
ncbi:MAG: FkbM family methyltransferase [Rhodobacteraceae bacterium]|nr:MAG: FkbM family methyltransferase [Paracoccaceae bacterium]